MIGPKSIEKIKGMVGEALDTYAGKINTAFLKSDDGKLKVSLSVDLSVSEIKSGVDVDVTIGFTADKVKDKTSTTVVENQVDLAL